MPARHRAVHISHVAPVSHHYPRPHYTRSVVYHTSTVSQAQHLHDTTQAAAAASRAKQFLKLQQKHLAIVAKIDRHIIPFLEADIPFRTDDILSHLNTKASQTDRPGEVRRQRISRLRDTCSRYLSRGSSIMESSDAGQLKNTITQLSAEISAWDNDIITYRNQLNTTLGAHTIGTELSAENLTTLHQIKSLKHLKRAIQAIEGEAKNSAMNSPLMAPSEALQEAYMRLKRNKKNVSRRIQRRQAVRDFFMWSGVVTGVVALLAISFFALPVISTFAELMLPFAFLVTSAGAIVGALSAVALILASVAFPAMVYSLANHSDSKKIKSIKQELQTTRDQFYDNTITFIKQAESVLMSKFARLKSMGKALKSLKSEDKENSPAALGQVKADKASFATSAKHALHSPLKKSCAEDNQTATPASAPTVIYVF